VASLNDLTNRRAGSLQIFGHALKIEQFLLFFFPITSRQSFTSNTSALFRFAILIKAELICTFKVLFHAATAEKQ
jgi:hypothetical protein